MALLQLAKSSWYYQPRSTAIADEIIMRYIDELYTEFPYYGSRKMGKAVTIQLGEPVNRKRIQRLMRDMGIEAMYPKPNLSRNTTPHPIYPYLLKGLTINKPNQVWGIDITYIRLATGWLYLVAILDWYSRFVVSWRLSNSLTTDFCLEAVKDAFTTGIPDICNSDQGTQFTSADYIELVTKQEVKISMDHRGRCFDNIFTERLWRTIKYEEVYLKDYQSPKKAEESLKEYLNRYNYKRLHQSLQYKTPAQIYFQ